MFGPCGMSEIDIFFFKLKQEISGQYYAGFAGTKDSSASASVDGAVMSIRNREA